MLIFNCDLYNTLIYSYKHDIGENKSCVEIYNEKELSYMTAKSIELLKKINEGLIFVPTTTRTIEQYKRIKFKDLAPKYALVCNGGILLINGSLDKAWYNRSLSLIADSKEELNSAFGILNQDENICFEIRNINELFIFTKSSAPEKTLALLKSSLNLDKVSAFNNGSKIYVVPKKLNKGCAALRLKKLLGAKKLFSAGDSDFDIPMLNAADFAFVPKSLAGAWLNSPCIKVFEENRVFSDSFLEYILTII